MACWRYFPTDATGPWSASAMGRIDRRCVLVENPECRADRKRNAGCLDPDGAWPVVPDRGPACCYPACAKSAGRCRHQRRYMRSRKAEDRCFGRRVAWYLGRPCGSSDHGFTTVGPCTGEHRIAQINRFSYCCGAGATVHLNGEDREQLKSWLRGSTTEQRMVIRANIILRLTEKCSVEDRVAEEKVNALTASKWRDRYPAQGIPGSQDAPCSASRSHTATWPRRISCACRPFQPQTPQRVSGFHGGVSGQISRKGSPRCAGRPQHP